MVKVVYLTRINFFSGRANVHTISKTCEALSKIRDIELRLISADNSLVDNDEKNKFFNERDVSDKFNIVSLNSLANRYKSDSNFLSYSAGIFLANLSLLRYVWREKENIDIVYFRDHLILPAIIFAKCFLNKKTIYESHYILTKKFGQWLTEKCVYVADGVVAITFALKDYYQKFNENIVVSFCASSDKEKFKTDFPASYYREKVGLEKSKFYLVYTGNIDKTGNGDSYGVEDIIHALPYTPKDVCFVAVGKKTEEKHDLEKLAESLGVSNRFKCLSWVSREKAVDYILSADILIIPKSGAKPGNSPTKMFEYLATERPIVAADTLPMREVLHDKINASLVDYNNPQAWAEAIDYIRNNPKYRDTILQQAMKDADLYTWGTRAETIGNFIKKVYA